MATPQDDVVTQWVPFHGGSSSDWRRTVRTWTDQDAFWLALSRIQEDIQQPCTWNMEEIAGEKHYFVTTIGEPLAAEGK